MDSHFVSVDVYDVEAKTLTVVDAGGPHAALVAAVMAYSPLFTGAAFLPEGECAGLLAEALREEIRPMGTSREKEVRRAIIVEISRHPGKPFDDLPRSLAQRRRKRVIEDDDFGIKDIELVDE
jgi:hypothetical protein